MNDRSQWCKRQTCERGHANPHECPPGQGQSQDRDNKLNCSRTTQPALLSWEALDSLCHIVLKEGTGVQNSFLNISQGYYKSIKKLVDEINQKLKKKSRHGNNL